MYDKRITAIMPKPFDWDEGTEDDEENCRNCNSPPSPTNLIYARSHAELAGRKDPPLTQGVSLKERLDTDDWEIWE